MSPKPAVLEHAVERTTGGRQVDVVDADVMLRLESHRPALTKLCRRLLGSAFEAEDAVQETLLRAWRNWDGYEGRAALYSWLYRIATNVCLDMLQGRQRRAHPNGLAPLEQPAPSRPADSAAMPWLQPSRVDAAATSGDDPADQAVSRESIRLAFLAALRRLPRRQRAVLILCDVLRWTAGEAAELLGTTVPGVNSALQRARVTLATSNVATGRATRAMDPAEHQLLACYVDAFERTDVDALVALL